MLRPCPNGFPFNGQNNDYRKSGFFSKRIQGLYFGQLQELTVNQLYSYACKCDPAISAAACKAPWTISGLINQPWYKSRESFCNELYKSNGELIKDSEKPFACGGTNPDIYTYNPANEVVKDLTDKGFFKKEDEKLNKKFTQIVALTIAIVAVIVIMYLILY